MRRAHFFEAPATVTFGFVGPRRHTQSREIFAMSDVAGWALFGISLVSLSVVGVLLYGISRTQPGIVSAVFVRLFCSLCPSLRVAPETQQQLTSPSSVKRSLNFSSPSKGSNKNAAGTPGRGGNETDGISGHSAKTPNSALPANRLNAGGELPADATYDWEIDSKKIRLKSVIGRGNFGEVFLATWLGSPVAVKTMLPELQSKEKLVRRFIDEILLMARLTHPNVVLFLGASIRKPALFLVLEYCSNGSLHHFLKRENEHGVRITMSLIYRFALDTARGIYYLHKKANVWQRDLKARNLLVDESLNVKVAE